jgi:hypothetical protein
MDAKQGPLRGGGVSTVEIKAPNEDQVVVETKGESTSKPITESNPKASESCKQSKAASESTTGYSKSVPFGCPSPEISRLCPSTNMPPKIPTTNQNVTQRRYLARSVYSKPKSRLVEQPYPTYGNMFDENGSTPRRVSIPQKPRLMESPGEDLDEEIYKVMKLNKAKYRRVKIKFSLEVIAFGCILACLISTLTANGLKTLIVWGLEFWKWCVLVMVIFSGMLITNWFMRVVVFFIERNFLLRSLMLGN